MSSLSFLEFHSTISRKPSSKPTQLRKSHETKSSVTMPKAFQPKMEDMRKVFDKFDTNKDGKISWKEYKLAVNQLGKEGADSEAAEAFRAADSDGDGYIDFEEFMEVHKQDGGVKVTDIQNAFRAFDLDGNGKISAEELREVLRRLGDKCSLGACRKMVKAVDTDGDGLINMDEFMTMMNRS